MGSLFLAGAHVSLCRRAPVIDDTTITFLIVIHIDKCFVSRRSQFASRAGSGDAQDRIPAPESRKERTSAVARSPAAHYGKEDAMAVEIVARKNGPYMVTGDLGQLELRDGDGNLYDTADQKRVFLCRCGASTTKPFCDGQHSKIGFEAAEAAVKAEG
jgi:3-phenylpropionate/trans-cinnamate dioxygenase ferredoxin subunit